MPALAIAPAAVGSAAASPAARPAPGPTGFAAALESRLPRPTPAPAPRPESPPALALRAVEAAQARLDAVLAAARSGRTFTAAELIGLQADAYRLAQTLDVAGKLVEQGVQGVKQAVQTQV